VLSDVRPSTRRIETVGIGDWAPIDDLETGKVQGIPLKETLAKSAQYHRQ